MSLKWLKYALKRQMIGAVPDLYWSGRHLLHGLLEPELALLARLCTRERVALDIGANWGAYTHAASKLAAAVHSFEPQVELARVLERGVGRRDNVVIHNIALSNVNGWTELRIPNNDIGYSTIEPRNQLLGKVDQRRGIRVVNVETRRLDDLALERVGFIKIDVEGHEIEVLEGGLELIRRDKPRLIVEVEERHRSGSVVAVRRLLGELGYRCFLFDGGGLAPASAASSNRNLIFIHAEQREALVARAV